MIITAKNEAARDIGVYQMELGSGRRLRNRSFKAEVNTECPRPNYADSNVQINELGSGRTLRKRN